MDYNIVKLDRVFKFSSRISLTFCLIILVFLGILACIAGGFIGSRWQNICVSGEATVFVARFRSFAAHSHILPLCAYKTASYAG